MYICMCIKRRSLRIYIKGLLPYIICIHILHTHTHDHTHTDTYVTCMTQSHRIVFAALVGHFSMLNGCTVIEL